MDSLHSSTELTKVEQDFMVILKKDKLKKRYQSYKSKVWAIAQNEYSIKQPQYQQKFLDSQSLIRFFIARDHKEDKAVVMWQKWVEWKIDFKIDEITMDQVFEQYKSGKAFIHKYDKEGRPCIIIRTRLHYPKQCDFQDFIRFGLYIVNKAVLEAEAKGLQTVSVIYDRLGWKKKVNYDGRLMGFVKKLLGMLQDYYAQRLAAVYILHVNWFFRLIYAIVKPFLSKKTTDKVRILKKVSDLKKYFDEDCLLPEHTGTSEYVHPYPESEKAPATHDGEEDQQDNDVDEKEGVNQEYLKQLDEESKVME